MQVSYQNSKDQLQEVLLAFSFRQRLSIRTAPLYSYLLGAAPATLLLLAAGNWVGLISGWALLCGYVLFSLIRKNADLFGGVDPNTWLPITLTLTPEFIGAEGGIGRTRRDWSLVKRIEQTPGLLLLFLNDLTFFAVPNDAFASPEDAKQFADTARQFVNRGNATGQPRFTPSAFAHTTDRDDTLEVRFSNTAGQLVEVRSAGMLKPKQPSFTSNFLRVMPLTLVSMVFVGLTRDTNWIAQFVSGSFAFYFISLMAIALINRIQVLRQYRQVPSSELLPQTVVISPDGMFTSSEMLDSLVRWKSIRAVEQNEEFLALFFAKPHLASLIPKSSFASHDDVERFFRLATRYYEAALATAPIAEKLTETGNPYQPPSTV